MSSNVSMGQGTGGYEYVNYAGTNARELAAEMGIDPNLFAMDPSVSFAGQQKAQATDKSNDGKFSLWQAGKNLVKGFCKPVVDFVKNAFSSPGQFLKSAALVAVGAVVAVTCPMLLVAVGAGLAAYKGVQGAGKIVQAISTGNGDIAEQAFTDFGEGMFYGVGAAYGARPALQNSGVSAQVASGMSNREAIFACAKGAPAEVMTAAQNAYADLLATNISGTGIGQRAMTAAQNVWQAIRTADKAQVQQWLTQLRQRAVELKNTAQQRYNNWDAQATGKQIGVQVARGYNNIKTSGSMVYNSVRNNPTDIRAQLTILQNEISQLTGIEAADGVFAPILFFSPEGQQEQYGYAYPQG